ncbi:MAG: HD domain-containing protein [Lentisphaeria bacterium]|nr:HD domain-containing protein [Lentisphaeria bacterium]
MIPLDGAVFEERFAALLREVEHRFAQAPACHGFDHTRRVLRNAERLAAAMPGADSRIVRLAALLHDIARADEIAGRGEGPCHAVRGAAMVPEILRAAGWEESWCAPVAAAVRTHRFRDGERPETAEAEIVYDADKLDSLGAVGIGRAFLFAGREGGRLHNDAATALSSPAYSREDTAYREYLVKLRKLPDAMLTAPGRAEAQHRAAIMKDFFDQLIAETGIG